MDVLFRRSALEPDSTERLIARAFERSGYRLDADLEAFETRNAERPNQLRVRGRGTITGPDGSVVAESADLFVRLDLGDADGTEVVVMDPR